MSIQNYVRSVSILIVFAVAPVAAAAQQSAVDRPQPVGSGRLTGLVIASDNGGPVRHAYVRLSGLASSQTKAGPPASISRSTETDTNGDFDFANLPAGSYYVTVDPVSGFVKPSRSKSAEIAEGQAVHITFRVERTGAIEGRVLDESGDGVLGVQVAAVQKINFGGYIKIDASGRSATTDDRGNFRIFNVPPGEYYVVASYLPPRLDINPFPRLGYTNTYHPSSLTLDAARSVVVRPARNTERVDVTMMTRHLVKVSVRAANSSGVPLDKEARLSLHRRDPTYLDTSMRLPPKLPQDGTFVFHDIMPGDYYLIVATSSRLEEAAYVNVTVTDKDLSLNVQTNTGARVSGRILVDGLPLTAVAGVGHVSVWAHRSWHSGISYAEVPRAEIQGTDRFELIGLRGPMVLEPSMSGGTLVSIKRSGQVIAGNALDLIGNETIDDVVIEFTRKMARLEVAITGTGAVDPEPVFLALFSDDPSLWPQGHVQYAKATATPKSGKPTPDSHPTLPPVVPGRYRIIAIPDPEISYPEDTAILEKLRPFAVAVTLVAGQTEKISIGVAKLVR